MKLRIHMTGEVLDVSPGEALDLLRMGLASKPKPAPKKTSQASKKDSEEPKETKEDNPQE